MSAVQTVERIGLRIADDLRLAGEARGQPSAPKVVLLHGGGQSRRAWDAGLRALAEAGYRAIALDMRGHGESDWPADGLYALEHWTGDVIEIVRQLATEGSLVALVGASRGGQSALLAAVALPHLVSCVVLVDVTPRNDDSGIALIRGFLERSAAGFETLDEAGAFLSRFMGRQRQASAAGLARVMRQDETGRWFWQWDPRMAHRDFVRPPSEQVLMEQAAAAVGVPVLLIRAGRSEIVRTQDVAHFQSLTPQLEVVEVPGIGHMISGDSNDAFLPPVLDFLRRTHPAAPDRRP